MVRRSQGNWHALFTSPAVYTYLARKESDFALLAQEAPLSLLSFIFLSRTLRNARTPAIKEPCGFLWNPSNNPVYEKRIFSFLSSPFAQPAQSGSIERYQVLGFHIYPGPVILC